MNRFLKVIALSLLLSPAITAESQSVVPRDGAAGQQPQAKAGPARGSRTGTLIKIRSINQQVGTSTPRKNFSKAFKVMSAAAENQSLPDIKGNLIYASDWTTTSKFTGVYTLPQANGDEFVKMFDSSNGMYGGVAIDGKYYCNSSTVVESMLFQRIDVYDIETGEYVRRINPSNSNVTVAADYAYSEVDGKCYGLFENASMGYDFGTIEFGQYDATVTRIASLPGLWNAIAVDKYGKIYAISKTVNADGFATGSSLATIDAATGTVTEIGPTGMMPDYASSATIDPLSNRMFWTVSTDTSGMLCEVDLITGKATKLVDFAKEEEVTGLFIVAPPALPGAPAAVTALKADFVNGSLEGTVSFTMPSTLFDGTAATGTAEYSILVNGSAVVKNTAEYGAQVSAPVKLTASGATTITVIATNAAGDSPKETVQLYAGKGTPKTPANVVATEDNGVITLNWDAVSESSDGGYINPTDVTYKVVCQPGDVVVADGLKATTTTYTVTIPDAITTYSFEVTATYDAKTSAAGKSNKIVLGQIVPPYEHVFDYDDNDPSSTFAGFTIINSNNDNRTWTAIQGAAQCMYHYTNDMDDWLISPPIMVEKGKAYLVSLDAWAFQGPYTERIEIKCGNAPTAEAMTVSLVSPTDIVGETPTHLYAYMVPTQTGKMYIGIHGISDAYEYALMVNNLKVAQGVASSIPAAATDIVVTPDRKGALTAEISAKVPTLTIDGQQLASVTKFEVLRGQETIYSVDNPKPGADITCTDKVTATGTYTYTFVATNESGRGSEVSASCFIGIGKPAQPASADVAETEGKPGFVTVTWEPVSKDVDGNYLDPENVTYNVYIATTTGGQKLVSGATGTSCEFEAYDPDNGQELLMFGVTSQTVAGENTTIRSTPERLFGTPYNGLDDSFTNGEMGYLYYLGFADYGCRWGACVDGTVFGLTSRDGDNGYLAFVGSYQQDQAKLLTGKIDLSGFDHPYLSFYAHTSYLDGEATANTITVDVTEWGGETVNLCSKKLTEFGEDEGWHRVLLDLSAYKGKVIQLALTGQIVNFTYSIFDNFHVGDIAAHDLNAVAITAPETVESDKDFNVEVTVSNDGLETSGAYTVKLFANDEEVGSKDCEPLASSQISKCTFTVHMNRFAETNTEVYAKVIYTADQLTDNNRSRTVSVEPVLSRHPRVTDLNATVENSSVVLSWTAPDLTKALTEPVTETFESGESFAHAFGDWTFVDVDDEPVGAFATVTVPGIEKGVTHASFFVFDNSDAQYNGSFAAHSGNKYLASLFPYNYSQADDWAISPRLCGAAQTISFYARSYSGTYPEKIDVLYSTGSLEPADFLPTKVKDLQVASSDWELVSADLPEGALYFAIRSHETGAYMLIVDDVTYSAAGGKVDLNLIGYNVFRNEEKLTATPVTECTYSDPVNEIGQYTYHVSAVYTQGESHPVSVIADVTSLGIADAATEGICVSADNNTIIVGAPAGVAVTVFTAAGVQVYNDIQDNDLTRIKVPAGVYIVRVGERAHKVAVK